MNDFKDYRDHKNFRALLLLRYQFTLLSCEAESDRLKVKQWVSTEFVRYYSIFVGMRNADITISADVMRYLNELYKWVKKRVDPLESRTVAWSVRELYQYSCNDVQSSKQDNNYPPYKFPVEVLHKIK